MAFKIDVASAKLLTLAQAAKQLPRRRLGRPVSPSTLHRWRYPGLHGVRLSCVRVGSVWYMTQDAIQEFCERLSVDAPAASTPPSSQQERDPAEDVERQLDELGI